jgi:hypothetical protein
MQPQVLLAQQMPLQQLLVDVQAPLPGMQPVPMSFGGGAPTSEITQIN